MKKIYLITTGTRGDVQPFVALALGLKEAGFDAVIVTAENEAAFVQSFGLTCISLSVNIHKIMEEREVQAMTTGDNPIAFAKSHLAASDKMKEIMRRVQEEIWEATADAAMLVYHAGQGNVFYMARERGIPCVMVSPFPIGATAEYPAILFYNLPHLGSLWNKASHLMFEQVFWKLGSAAAKEFWKQRGKAHILSGKPVSRLQAESGMPLLLGYSPQLFPRPKGWRENQRVVGALNLASEPSWEAPRSLVEFLANGEAPVYVGFGSMKDSGQFEKTLTMILRASENLGIRTVVGLGWSEMPNQQTLPESTYLLGSAPHSWLFPKMKAVVHHGGAGTISAGLLAGKPSLVIPHLGDQPAWGRRLWELGVGAKPIPKKVLTEERLTTGLQELLQKDLAENAAKIGEKMRQENGVRTAVEVIQQMLGQVLV